MKRLITSLLATCLVAVLSLTSFSGNAWAYDQSQLDLLKSGVEQWNNWRFSTGSSPDLSGADLSGLNLTDAFLRFSDLSGANLTGTNLHDADLISVKLNNANLTGANLTEAAFSDTDFTGANLTKADLSGYHYVNNFVNFQGANLTDANLDSRDLSGCDSSIYSRYDSYSSFDQYRCKKDYPHQKKGVSFDQVTYNENTKFPPGIDPKLAVTKNPETDRDACPQLDRYGRPQLDRYGRPQLDPRCLERGGYGRYRS